jgi:hypothetical protein
MYGSTISLLLAKKGNAAQAEAVSLNAHCAHVETANEKFGEFKQVFQKEKSAKLSEYSLLWAS